MQLSENLVLRSVRDDRDRDVFVSFNSACNNPLEGATCECLLYHHPNAADDNYWVVEDTARHEIVSTTLLIPWECRFAGIPLRTAQLEMVLTNPGYRGRGLVRRQMENYERAVQSRGYDVGIIWGIPYYYRQYGYGYAIEGETRESLPGWKIPLPAPGASMPIRIRPATVADVPLLTRTYADTTSRLDIRLERSPAHWRFLLEACRHPVNIVENGRTGEPCGYVTFQDRPGLVAVLESGLQSGEAALAVLQYLGGRGCPEILVAGPSTSAVTALAVSLGSKRIPGGQWLIRFPDVAQFLTRIAPVLECRLAASAWCGLTRSLIINLFRKAYRLRFEEGRVAGVDSLGFVDSSMGADGGDVQIPPDAFVRLVTGFRGLPDLYDAWPDTVVNPSARALVEVLFPRLSAYIYTPYHRADVII
jgi:GNAT superfamily N-acetyltransferase